MRSGTSRRGWPRPILPLSVDQGRHFLYARYNVDLGAAALDGLGFGHVDPKGVQKMDNATSENIETLLAIGDKAAAQVSRDHFGPFV